MTLPSKAARGAIQALMIIVATTLAACGREIASPAASGSAEVLFGKATSSTDMTLSSLTPDSATQDTTVDVVINGSGFVAGTAATWSLNGNADSTQIRTNRTTYVSSRKLIANITVSGTATIGSWDVIVTASGKKGGIGTEMFAVRPRHVSTDTKPSVIWTDMVNVAPANEPAVWEPALITGDYRARDGSPLPQGESSGEYFANFCGVDGFMQDSRMTYPQAALNMDADHLYDAASMDGPCGGRRYYQFFFGGRAAAPLQFAPQHFALRLGDLAVGESIVEEVHFGIQQANCSALHFNDAYSPASSALVVRLPDSVVAGIPSRRWRVQSQGSHRAMCTMFSNKGPKPTGVTHYLPFAFTVIELYQPFARFP